MRVGAFMILMICEVCVCVDAGRWDEGVWEEGYCITVLCVFFE